MPLWSLSTIPSLVILSSSPDNTDVVFHQPSVPLPGKASLVGPKRRRETREAQLLWAEKGIRTSSFHHLPMLGTLKLSQKVKDWLQAKSILDYRGKPGRSFPSKPWEGVRRKSKQCSILPALKFPFSRNQFVASTCTNWLLHFLSSQLERSPTAKRQGWPMRRTPLRERSSTSGCKVQHRECSQ